jgi:hypothetical protein
MCDMRHWLLAAAIVVLLVGSDRAQGPAFSIEPLSSPAGENAQEPQLTTSGDHTILSWLEVTDAGNATLKFAERTMSGWSEARTVASGSDFFVNSADLPSVLRLSDGTLVGHWLQQNGEGETYNLRLSRSKDNGKTWSRPTSPHHDGTRTQHGFASLFEAPGGGLGVVWLDGRATKPEAEGAEFGNMSLRSATYNKAGKQLGELAIDTRVCDCCSTATAVTADGPIVAYRDRSATEIRDIYVSRLAGGRWSAPVSVHEDGWKIAACPINGPAISARGKDVVVAWFAAPSDEGKTFAAFSHDAGRTFGPPIRIDNVGALGRVGVELLNDGSAAVTWVEFANQRGQFAVRRVEQNGTRGPIVNIAPSGGPRFPRIAQHGDELLFAWTEAEGGNQRVRTARAALSAIR